MEKLIVTLPTKILDYEFIYDNTWENLNLVREYERAFIQDFDRKDSKVCKLLFYHMTLRAFHVTKRNKHEFLQWTPRFKLWLVKIAIFIIKSFAINV